MKGLEAFYKIRSPKENMTVEEYGKLLDIVEKELKAYEELNSVLDFSVIKKNNEETYYLCAGNTKHLISKARYDLLKEILENE